jgi:hypothetical protein
VRSEAEKAEKFSVEVESGHAFGLFAENTIFVHSIMGKSCVKEIMNILVKRFKTTKVIFTPLINDNIENCIRGEIKICKANNPQNPYGEDIRYMECEWVLGDSE